MVQNSAWFPRKKEESEERKNSKLLRIVVLNEARLNVSNFIVGQEEEKTLRKEKEREKKKKKKKKREIDNVCLLSCLILQLSKI